MNELPKNYDPQALEPRWETKWGTEPFRANATSGKPPFTVVIPPPNVTGSLHLGHALDNSIIDTIVRYKRMAGFEALYLPGTDHAGISTQVIVERELKKEGLSRHDLGREAFLERVWNWKVQSGGQIVNQLKRLGVSCDWTRERFTMDEGLSRAVRHQFVRLFHQGLAYRGERIVNWDPVAQTTLSDLEIDRKEQKGKMYTLAYPLRDATLAASNGEVGELRISTVRPETIFADQAIAVHPEDPRFSHLIGQEARIPLTDRYIPIIADEAVERDFGVGALKITPAHDPTDFEIGERHNLPRPSVIDLQGMLCSDLVPAEFLGMERFAARKAVVAALAEHNFLVEEKDHTIPLGFSQRTAVPVEPMISVQWFVHMKPMADRVLQGLDAGDMELLPERWEKVNRDWLENTRDWNISRQLWWGHQIPAWYDEDGQVFVPSLENPDQDPVHPEGKALHRDPDVFDTWFSSNLWPFSTLDWPDEASEDFQKFYPTSLLVTGYDILFFWVARMQMAGYHFTGQAPFKQILLHGLYLDSKGQKMSKTKGNGIDPLELIAEFGADACRFALTFLATGGQDVRHDVRRFEQGRHFANKLWNAARFVMINLEGESSDQHTEPTLADRWILSRLNETVKTVTEHMDNLDLAAAIRVIYGFTWDEYCDWYIEAGKPALRAGNSASRATAQKVLEGILKLLHPFMPFITSEIYEALGHRRQLAVHSWPKYNPELFDAEATQAFEALRDAVSASRSLKNELGLAPQEKLDVAFAGSEADLATLEANRYVVEGIARVNMVSSFAGKTLSQVTSTITARVLIEGTVDLQEWLARSQKRLAELDKQITQAQNKLNNAGFVARAPQEVIEEEQRRVADFGAQKARLLDVLAQF